MNLNKEDLITPKIYITGIYKKFIMKIRIWMENDCIIPY